MSIANRLGAGLLAAALLVGCGPSEPEAGPAGDETTGQTEQPSENVPNGPIDVTDVGLVSVSDAGGQVDPQATVLDSEAVVGQFAGQFDSPQMAQALSKGYQRADVPNGEVMVGAVVDISCDPPRDVTVEKTGRGVEITAVPVKSTNECLVPVTTVALVSVPDAAA